MVQFIELHGFEVKGVKDGEIYATDIKVEVKNKLIQPDIILNGKVIDSAKTISANGEYKLEVESRFLWRHKKVVISFKRDNQPPEAPELVDPPKKSYLKAASFQIDKKPGVIYEATIGHDPYEWGDEFTKEGKHTLYIVAHKENGLSSKNHYVFEIDNRTYSQAEIDAFIELYFNRTQGIMKYKSETDVFVRGNPTKEDLYRLQLVTEELDELLPIRMNFKEKIKPSSNSRIDVYFVPTDEFKYFGYEGAIITGRRKIVGVAWVDQMYPNIGISDSTVLIGSDTTQKDRLATITHEMLHAVGLHGHFNNDKNSILYPETSGNVQTWTEKDLKTLEILYRSDIEMGMEKAQVINTLKNRMKN